MSDSPRPGFLPRGLSERNLQPEIMDRPDLDPDQHLAALRGLARVNWVSRSAGIVWGPIRRLARRRQAESPRQTEPLRVLDLASGGGDIAIGLAHRARRGGVNIEVVGYDLSPTAVAFARQRATELGCSVRFEARDVFADPWEGPFDVVTCSLFLHHLDERRASELLGQMARTARRLVVVNDLSRSPLGYLVAQVVCHTITRSDVVHNDGPRSVAAAFQPGEARRVAELAGLAGARVRRMWPFRFLLTWEPTA